jgi:hypothetical protein
MSEPMAVLPRRASLPRAQRKQRPRQYLSIPLTHQQYLASLINARGPHQPTVGLIINDLHRLVPQKLSIKREINLTVAEPGSPA